MSIPCVDEETNILFNEIIHQSENKKNDIDSDYVQVYVIQVDPQDCGHLIKWLSKELPLSTKSVSSPSSTSLSTTSDIIIHDLSHLKRVRKYKNSTHEKETRLDHKNNVDLKHEKQVISDLQQIQNNSPPIKKAKHSSEQVDTLIKKDSTTGRNFSSKKVHDETIQVLLHVTAWLDKSSSEDDNDINECRTNLEILLEKMTKHFNSSILRKSKSITDDEEKFLKDVKGTTSFHVRKESVPGRNATTEDEWRLFNNIWPIHYFPNQMLEDSKENKLFSDREQEQMVIGMKAAIKDRLCNSKYNLHGTVVLNPKNGQIVSTSYDEYCIQQKLFDSNQQTNLGGSSILLCQQNPLITSIILACQGVSRIERRNAQDQGMKSENFQKGQYICTGYDVYTTLEPTTYEAMALIHSRINRLVFGCCLSDIDDVVRNNFLKVASSNSNQCQLRRSSGILHSQVHSIPGVNHKYRAFQCKQNSELWSSCCLSYRRCTTGSSTLK
jgi:hypothetical protein